MLQVSTRPGVETQAGAHRSTQDYDGELSFSTDAWTSPNNRPYVAVAVHFEHDGEPMCMLLDIVEVSASHSGVNLAAAFAKILEDFGISDKVCSAAA